MKLTMGSCKLAFSLFKPSSGFLSNSCLNSTTRTPIVILHSLWSQRTEWSDFARNLSEKTRRTVFTLDARNHGQSDRSDRGNYVDMAADVEGFLTQHRINQCHILGHSMGGRTAMVLALTKPSFVRSLSVLDVSPDKLPDYILNRVIAIAKYFQEQLRAFGPDVSIEQAREKCYQDLEAFKASVRQRKVAIDNIVKVGDKFEHLTNLEFVIKNTENDLVPFPKYSSQFKGPAHFMAVDKSTYLPQEHYPAIKKLFPNATIKSLPPGVGHYVHMGNPTILQNEYLTFFMGIADNESSYETP